MRLLLAALLLAALSGLPAHADPELLADDLQIVVLARQLLAIDAQGGGQLPIDLELGEQVLWHGARGVVGVALTDRRVLAVAARSGAWQTERYRRIETAPERALLGARVALVATRTRVFGFDGGSANLVETGLGPRERLLLQETGQNVAVAVTDRRALGLSPFRGGFFETRLRLNERVERVDAQSDVATLVTSRRLLIFRAASGTWEERRLDLADTE